MKQTFLSHIWTSIRALPCRRTTNRPQAWTGESLSRAERDRLPEHDESFYWGWCMHGHW